MLAKLITLFFIIYTLAGCSSMSHTNDKESHKKLQAARANTQLGMAYLEKKEFQRAKQKFLLALEDDPTLPEAWYSMGYLMEITGDPENAKRYYLKSVDLAPKQGDVQNNYGTFLCRNGEYQEAIQHFMLAVSNQAYLDSAAAYENAGLCALKIPNKTLALKYFNRAIQEDPNHPSALIEAAALNYQAKNYRDAKIQLAEFLSISSPTAQSMALSRELQKIEMPYSPMVA